MLDIRRSGYSILLAFTTLMLNGFASAENSQVIRYCADPNWAPYESIEDGQHIGIAKEYLNLIEQNSNFVFQLVETTSWRQAIENVKSNKCQMLPMLNASPQREQFLSFSNVYFRAPNALYAHYDRPLIGNLTSIQNEKVAVVESYRMHNFLTDNYHGMTIVAVDNEEQGLAKVQNGEIDFFVGSFHSTNKIIQNNEFRHIRIVGIAELEDNLRIGVNDQNKHLLPALNSAISKITPEQHARIFSYLKQKSLITKTDYSLVIQAIAISVIIVFLLAIAYFRSVKNAATLAEKNTALELLHQQLDEKNKLLAEAAIKDSLTGLYNRNHFNEIIEQQIKLKDRYGNAACLLMIDIDDFKKINDSLGHSVGDEVLKQFAFILSSCAREADMVARWGGEEFVMLCPETKLSDAKTIATRFQKQLKELKTDAIPKVTCSIGIALLQKEESADAWFVAADSAMYHAKQQGKNTVYTIEA